jgi:muramoyltetrapeptide carboxypeptidase
MTTTITPPYLQPGDTIAITCPAGFLPYHKVEACVATLQLWGFRVIVGNTVGNQHHYFAGTIEERKTEIQNFLNDTTIQAILCGRGGYGVSQIIDTLNFEVFKQHPKWLLGFSDITLLLNHILANYQVASMHCSMAAAFTKAQPQPLHIQAIHTLLTGGKQAITQAFNQHNVQGIAAGTLIGGNLTLMAHIMGTNSLPQGNNYLLFLEDVGEYLYNIDRMLHQLKRAGLWQQVKGIIVGGFTDMKDTTIPYGKSINAIISEHLHALNIPVAFDMPISHGEPNYPVKVGGYYQLHVHEAGAILQEV